MFYLMRKQLKWIGTREYKILLLMHRAFNNKENHVKFKFNSFMAYFVCTSPVVKNKLFQQYCIVFYGFWNCALYNKDIERWNVTSRKALRILWRLPYQTHSALLPHITGIPAHDVGIAKRFLKHVHTGFNHDNSLVRFRCQNTMYTDSRIDTWHINVDFILRI